MSTSLLTAPDSDLDVQQPWLLPTDDLRLDGEGGEDIEEFDDDDFDDDFNDDFEEEDDFDDDLPEELDEDELKSL